MADCERFEEMISAYLDNELTENEKAELMAHAASCPSCASLLKTYTLLFSKSAPVSAPKGFTASVMGAAGTLRAPQRAKKRAPIIRILALSAACLLLVAAVYPIMNAAFGGAKSAAPATAGGTMVYSMAAPESAEAVYDCAAAVTSEEVKEAPAEENTAENGVMLAKLAPSEGSDGLIAGAADDTCECDDAADIRTSESFKGEKEEVAEPKDAPQQNGEMPDGSTGYSNSILIPSVYIYGDLPEIAAGLEFIDNGDGSLYAELDAGLADELIRLGYEHDGGEITRLVWFPGS